MLSWLGRLLGSSIGKKVFMALTGLALIGFLIVHVAGNLTLFVDEDGSSFNAYAHALESNPLLPIAEVGLLALLVAHIALGLRVSMDNKAARESRYELRASMGEKTLASSSMLVTGIVILIFLVVHIVDFRIPKMFDDIDLAEAVKVRLSSPLGAGIYLVGVAALGLHLSHAFKSAFQTLGINHPRYTPWIRCASLGLAVLLFLGFASFPIYYFLQGGGAE